MNRLTKALLGGTALGALAMTPVMAGHAPGFHVQALHAGKRVDKTRIHNRKAEHITYTVSVSTAIPAELHKAVPLTATFYKWNTYDTAGICVEPKQRITAQKKSTYGKIHTAIETYTLGNGCKYLYYGDAYKLIDAAGAGKGDSFTSTLYGKFRNENGFYKGKLNLDVSVAIGTDQPADRSN